MKKSHLDDTLKAARLPQRSAAYWEQFARRVVEKARSRPPHPAPKQPKFRGAPGGWTWMALPVGVVFCATTGWWAAHGPLTTARLPQNEKLLRDTLRFYPNRVRAIVQDQQGVHLFLSDRPDVPASNPLWLKICDGRQCRWIVTFSGQEFPLGDEKVEALANPQGQVMLVGNNWVWSSQEKWVAADRLRIEAGTLSPVL